MCKVRFIVIPYALFNSLYYTVRVIVYGVIQWCCKIEWGGVNLLKIISLLYCTTSRTVKPGYKNIVGWMVYILLIILGPQAHMSRYQGSGNIEVSGNIDTQQVYAHLPGIRRVHAYIVT
jgi:hypothetical protein